MEIGAVVLVAIGVIAVGIGLIVVPKPVLEPTVAGGRPARSSMGTAAAVLGAVGVLCALIGLILRVAD